MLFACVVSIPAFAHGPDIAKGIAFEQHPGAQLPLDSAFVDDAGRGTTLGRAMQGKPTVLVLGYLACKDLCPMTLAGVTRALDQSGLDAGRDYRGVFVSIDPRETQDTMRGEKRKRIGVADRGAWTFLRGRQPSVDRLAKAVGFRYRYEREQDTFAHAAGFAVVTPEGAISKYFLGVRFDPASLATAVHGANAEAIAPTSNPLLLLCYHFDPTTGRYTLAILDILRAAIAALFIAAALWTWRHRRRTREARP